MRNDDYRTGESSPNPGVGDLDWSGLFADLDRTAAAAARRDRQEREISSDELAQGFAELACLRQSAEPNYEQRGLGTAYLLYYLAKRAANFAAAVVDVSLQPTVRVLDIGSGTNATALALSSCFKGIQFEIWAAEPSEEMATAGKAVVSGLQNVTFHGVRTTFDDLLEQRSLPFEEFDLICLSAMLPYDWDLPTMSERVEFGEQLLMRIVPGGSVVVVEPAAKRIELLTLQRYLARVGMACRTVSALDGSPPDPGERRLVETTALLGEWHPAMSLSPNFSSAANEMLGSPWALGIRSRLPDVALIATRAIGPAPHREPKRITSPAYAGVGAAPPHMRTRAPRRPGVRDWVTGGLILATAIGGLAYLATQLPV